MTTENAPGLERMSRISTKEVQAIVSQLQAVKANGRSLTHTDRILAMRRLAEAGGLESLEPILPLALTLNGKPYSLRDHYPFSPFYNVSLPKTSLWMTGRQVSKSTNLAAHGVILSNCIPNLKTLYVTPLYEQIRRFSNNYVRPFIDQSPIKSLWSGTSTENSVLQRSFKNLSLMIFSFALLDADRIRGVSADKVAIDEVQDMDPDHLPIIGETMSHSSWALRQFTGTPKSIDNPIEGLWRKSSQAQWFVPCYNCPDNHGRTTWNIPSAEYHIDAMIGPYTELISTRRPAILCHKCRRPIDPRPPHGRWVHKFRDKRGLFEGFHIPQIILPLHCCRPDKWAELLNKRESIAPHTFYNEVLGESVDQGQKIVTETELKAASILDWENNPRDPDPRLMESLTHYRQRVLAVDWGGGGEEGVSFTSLALLGLRPDGKIDVLWGKRLLTPNDHMKEAKEVIWWINQFGCHLMAHDYTGAGIVRETVMVQAGFDVERIMPIQYVRAASRNLMTYVPSTPLHQRDHYRLDKTRSLLYTCQAIKLQMVRFFKYDTKPDDDKRGLISDFLALVEEKAESRLAGDIYTITRNPMFSDDFAQAVNIGCAAIWHANGIWPDFAKAAAVGRVTAGQIEATGNRDYGWDNDRTMQGYMGMP